MSKKGKFNLFIKLCSDIAKEGLAVEVDYDLLLESIFKPEESEDGEYKYRFVYLTQNKINLKYYVGQHSTNDLQDGYLGSGTNIRRAIKKYGRENFKMGILEYCNSVDELNEKEEKWVKHFKKKSKSNGGGRCYNIADGGKYFLTKEIMEKSANTRRERLKSGEIVIWNKGKKGCYSKEQLKNLSNKAKSRKLSEETKAKIGDGVRGKVLTEETKQKISKSRKLLNIQLTEEQKESVAKKQREYNSKNMSNCIYCGKLCTPLCLKAHHNENCKSNPNIVKIKCPHCVFEGTKMSSMKRYHFDNCDFNKNRVSKTTNSLSKKVKQIDPLTGEIIKIWDSASQVTKFLGIHNVGNACKYKRKFGGFFWEHFDNNDKKKEE